MSDPTEGETPIRSRVILHPETVAKAETIAKETRKRKRKRKPKKPEPEVTHRYTKRPEWVNKKVWDTALQLSDNQPKRIRVESETTVVVENHAP